MSTITKKELVERIAQRNQVKTVTVKAIVQNFLDEVIVELTKGNRLEFRDFGVFEPREQAPRMAQNPKTLEQVYVPAKQVVKYKASRLVKQKLNNQRVETRVLIPK
jgi:integration host factor subunit beta